VLLLDQNLVTGIAEDLMSKVEVLSMVTDGDCAQRLQATWVGHWGLLPVEGTLEYKREKVTSDDRGPDRPNMLSCI
jgi:hypothetical protein